VLVRSSESRGRKENQANPVHLGSPALRRQSLSPRLHLRSVYPLVRRPLSGALSIFRHYPEQGDRV